MNEVPAAAGAPPIEQWETEIGRRRAARVAEQAVTLARSGATGEELSRALLPWLGALSDRQCVMVERALDTALADLRDD